MDKSNPTQVGRALKTLGIQHIDAYSPQARGRYLQEVYLPRHNQQFTVPPADKNSAYIPYIGRDLADVLCVQEVRVMVHERLDGTIAIFFGNRLIGEYSNDGQPLVKKEELPVESVDNFPLAKIKNIGS